METLDNLNEPQKGTAIWDTVLRFGLYGGGAMVVFSLLTYLTEFNMMTIMGGITMFLMALLISFGIAIFAIKHQRDKLDGGYINYGKALLVALLAIILAMIISGIWSFIFTNFIDPDYIVKLKDQFIETWGGKMPEEAMEQTLESLEKAGEIGTSMFNAIKGGLVYGLIASLITAGFMKREQKPSYM
ncbi:MAG: DUF4199 domain-containing protein [Saprospiraceae bacterium]